MTRGKASKRASAAIVAASQRWQEAAVHIRGQLRARGVRGELRPLNTFASGQRGKAAVRQLLTLVRHAHAGGLPAHVIASDLGALTAGIVADVYSERLDGVA